MINEMKHAAIICYRSNQEEVTKCGGVSKNDICCNETTSSILQAFITTQGNFQGRFNSNVGYSVHILPSQYLRTIWMYLTMHFLVQKYAQKMIFEKVSYVVYKTRAVIKVIKVTKKEFIIDVRTAGSTAGTNYAFNLFSYDTSYEMTMPDARWRRSIVYRTKRAFLPYPVTSLPSHMDHEGEPSNQPTFTTSNTYLRSRTFLQ